VYGLGAVVGGVLFTYLSFYYGQRKTILCLAIPDLFGWIMIGLSSNVAMLCTGRFLTGIAGAGYVPAIQVCCTPTLITKNRVIIVIKEITTYSSIQINSVLTFHTFLQNFN